MTKKAYMKPTMNVVKIQQQHVICASDNYGMSKSLNSSEVNGAWSRSNRGWSDDEE